MTEESNFTAKSMLSFVTQAYMLRLDKIGLVLQGQMKKEARQQKIWAKGDFVRNMDYEVVQEGNYLGLKLGSNVEHAQYVLGGKIPSWTPIDPIIEWIKTRRIVWYDNNDKKMKPKQMAFLISRKHSRVGIPERNIPAEVIEKRRNWIDKQLNSVEI